MDETWKPIPGHPKYEASSLGRIRNAATGQVLNPWLRAGYPTVNLRDGPKRKLRSVHTVIAETFIGPRPTPGRHHCAHRDGNKLNPAVSNLTWATPSENARHKRDHGTNGRPATRKFSAEQASIIRSIVCAGTTRTDLAELLGVPVSTVANIVNGKFYND